MTCTFFGHRSVPDNIEPILRSTLIDLIEKHGVNLFYVGNHGEYVAMVGRTLKDLSTQYPITYHIVLAYLPKSQSPYDSTDYAVTLLPDGIENVPRRFAITYRNKWMLQHSDYVVTYVTNRIGSGAAQFKELAEKQGKKTINLYCGND